MSIFVASAAPAGIRGAQGGPCAGHFVMDGRPKKATGLSAAADLAQVALTHAVSGKYKDLDIALVKATNHDPVVPKQKHVITIYNAIGRAESGRDTIRYALTALGERVASATEWLVVLKALMVVHRLMRDAESDRFRTTLSEMLFGGRGRDNGERRRGEAGAGLLLFNLGGFKDDSSPEAWEMSGWVRAYALYLEERCAVFADTRCDPQCEAPGAPSAARSWSPPALLANLPRLQSLLRRLVDTLPRLPRMHPVAAAAAVDTLRETRLLFRAVSDGVINLVDQFFDMPPHEATQALDMYRRAVRQVADLNAALRSLVAHEQLAAEMTRLPHPFDPPPADFLKVMEDYINSPDGHKGRTGGNGGGGHNGVRRDASGGPPSPPMYTLTPSLPPSMPMPAGVAAHVATGGAAAAPAARSADPFDLLGGVEELSLAPPPLPPHGHGGGAPHAPPAPPPPGGDLFDLLSAPAPAAAPAAPAPAAAPPQQQQQQQQQHHAPPPALNKGLLDSLYDAAPQGLAAGGAFGAAPPFGMGMAPPAAAHNPFAAFEPPGATYARVSHPGNAMPMPMPGMYGAPPPQQQQQPFGSYGAPQQQQPHGGYGAPPPPFGSSPGFGGGMGGMGAPQQQWGAPPPPPQMFGAQLGGARPPPPSTNPFA